MSRLLAIALLSGCLLGAASPEFPILYHGQSIVGVNVALSGPRERLLALAGDTETPVYTYTAVGSYGIRGARADDATGLEIREQYSWSCGNAEKVSGGGPDDTSVTVRYKVGDDAANTIAVTYSVTGGGRDAKTIDVVVPHRSGNTDGAEPDGEMTCRKGIVSPGGDNGFLVGSEVPLKLGEAIDWDVRHGAATTNHNGVNCLAITWTATAGRFKGDAKGRDVVWIAPATAQSGIVVTATIKDGATGPDHEDCSGRVEPCDRICSITLTAMDVSTVVASRSGTSGGARIAAGGIRNSTHQADVTISVAPIPAGSYSLTIPVSVSGTAANGGNPSGDDARPSVLSIGGAKIAGSSGGMITMSTPSVTGTFLSSNRMGTCTFSARGSSASIEQKWDCAGAYDFRFPYYMVEDQPDDVNTFPTLQEVAELDEDGDGIMGEGAIGGHAIQFCTRSVKVLFWEYDFRSDSYTTPAETREFAYSLEDGEFNYDTVFGVKVNDLVVHTGTTEVVAGHYKNSQTIKSYMEFSPSGEKLRVVVVRDYNFATYDGTVYTAQ